VIQVVLANSCRKCRFGRGVIVHGEIICARCRKPCGTIGRVATRFIGQISMLFGAPENMILRTGTMSGEPMDEF
jgi:hypothetical protein